MRCTCTSHYIIPYRWHLSHGQYHIGHLGSRFGKMAWALAMARHNSIVPYTSVDGHTPCCEIDEVCANATAVMRGMADCLTFGHELVGARMNKDYWARGSTVRWNWLGYKYPPVPRKGF